MDFSTDNHMDDLLSQLKDSNDQLKAAQRKHVELDPNNIQDFIYRTANELINSSLDILASAKTNTTQAPLAEDIEAIAKLIQANSQAIDLLNKIFIQQERNQAQIQVQQLKNENKNKLPDTKSSNEPLRMTREEMLEHILKDAKVVDVETE